MKLHYGIHQPLRIYEKQNHQNRFRPGSEGNVFPLLCPLDRVIPFQIVRSASVLPITSLLLRSIDGGSDYELIADIDSSELDIFYFPTYDRIVYYGQLPHGVMVDPGRYELMITDGVNTWYSEVMTMRDFDPDDLSLNNCCLTKITYWDTCDVADIFYRTADFGGKQYKNIAYLDIGIGKPEYPYEDEGEEDGAGVFHADFKRIEKQYLLQGVFPEYMVDALTLLPLHVSKTGVIEVLTQYGYTGQVDRIGVDPKWQGDFGVWALTDLVFTTEFTIDYNCCNPSVDDIPVDECLRDIDYFVAKIWQNSPDFANFEYTSAVDGVTKVPLVEGDIILVLNMQSKWVLVEFTGAGYNILSIIRPLGETWADLNELNGNNPNPSIYWFWGGASLGFKDAPEIVLSNPGGQWRVNGPCWFNCLVQVWVDRPSPLTDIMVAQGTGEQYISPGIDFQWPTGPPGNYGVYVVCVGLNCTLGSSKTKWLGGISAMQIGNDFKVGVLIA